MLTQTIILFQDTSLVYAIGAYDLLKGFVTAGKIYGRPEEAYLLAAIVYFVMCFGLSYWSSACRTRSPSSARPPRTCSFGESHDQDKQRLQVVRPRSGAEQLLGHQIEKGDVVVVCGPSGSGKSTLIKTVNALEPVQKGKIFVDGPSLQAPTTNLPKLR